jgi:transaldolase
MNDHGRADTPLQRLTRLGQSVWIDWLSRNLLASGELQRLIAEHAVVGVTNNPTILERAITGGGAYDRQIRDLIAFGLSAHEIATELARADVSEAALQLLPVWQASGGADGYVSWEVSPALAWNPGRNLRSTRPAARAHRPPEPARQDPRNRARTGGDRGLDRRRVRHQRDLHLLSRALRRGG